MSSRARMRFFRPGVCGAFGAVAAAAKVVGCDVDTTNRAMGLLYSQICGTLQPHHEGVTAISMQPGFNAKAAVMAPAFARQGIAGSRQVLEGEYGYFRLFEGAYDLTEALTTLGTSWEVERLSHKPFPSGRLTHGAVEAAWRCDSIPRAAARHCQHSRRGPTRKNLVGRALQTHTPSPQFARLCLPLVLAHVFLKGDVFINDFAGSAH